MNGWINSFYFLQLYIMKLTKLQIKTLASRAYWKIINSPEYREREERLQEKVDNTWKEYKKTALYKEIESILNKDYINSISIPEVAIAKNFKGFKEGKFNWHINITKANHENTAKCLFERMYKPKDIYVSDIEESIILNSIVVPEGTTVDDMIQSILNNFEY